MRTNLALANITSNLAKTTLSLAGIGVAIVLIFLQMGFRGAIENTATNIYNRLDFDLLIRSRDYLHFVDSATFSRDVCNEIAGMQGVASVNRVFVTVVTWRNPIGEFKGILLLGVDPDDSPFRDPAITAQLDQLVSLDSLLVDDKTHREFGPLNKQRFTSNDIGRTVQVSDQPMKIAGLFNMGAGLAANGAILASLETLTQLVPYYNENRTTFGLIKLAPGENAQQRMIEFQEHFQTIAGDPKTARVEILDRAEVVERELVRWMGETPIGFIFTLGVIIAFLVGAAVVYMVLSNDVADRIHEYATLRAMGYSNLDLARVVMQQALYLALFSFFPSLVVSLGLYWLTSALASIELEMNWQRIGFVFGLTLVMCCLSGAMALRKLWQMDPAELF